jgi:hypothetical protein
MVIWYQPPVSPDEKRFPQLKQHFYTTYGRSHVSDAWVYPLSRSSKRLPLASSIESNDKLSHLLRIFWRSARDMRCAFRSSSFRHSCQCPVFIQASPLYLLSFLVFINFVVWGRVLIPICHSKLQRNYLFFLNGSLRCYMRHRLTTDCLKLFDYIEISLFLFQTPSSFVLLLFFISFPYP